MGFRDENIIPLSMVRKSFLDKSCFTGSYKSIRYKYEKVLKDNIEFLRLYIWDIDVAYEYVDKDLLKIIDFSYDNDGIIKSFEYIEKYQEGQNK